MVTKDGPAKNDNEIKEVKVYIIPKKCMVLQSVVLFMPKFWERKKSEKEK